MPTDTVALPLSLRDALAERQRDLGLSERRFAALLSTDVSTWTRFKGGTDFGNAFLGGVLIAFPDMETLVAAYLRDYRMRTKRA